MSVRTDIVNLRLKINHNEAMNNLNDLKKRAADLRDGMIGLKKSSAEYIAKAKELKQVNGEMEALKKTIGLTALSEKELVAELKKLNALKGSVAPFSDEYKKLHQEITQVNNRLYDVRNGTTGFRSTLSKLSDGVKEFGVAAAAFLGFQFITSTISSLVKGGAKLSDQMADLRRVTGFTTEEATRLNAALSAIDTRTSTSGLREIAIVAGKLGIEGVKGIADFTQATDMLVVALGDELGNADKITETLGKILNVFDGEINGDNISKLGNAFVELANAGVATGGFIAEFDQRLSGIAKSANIGLGELSGLAAGLEEFGGRVESSSTAVQKLLIGIAQDIPKAAKVAGLSAAEFRKIYDKDALEALLLYSEGLVKNEASFVEVTGAFKDAGEEGARVIETISKLGSGADLLRTKIKLGADAIKETTAINEAFALKNENLGATVDKLNKEFTKLVMGSGIMDFMAGAVEITFKLVKALRALPQALRENQKAVVILSASLAILTRNMVASALTTARDTINKIANAIATRSIAAATNIAIAAQASYVVVTNLLAGRITFLTAVTRLWNIAMGFSIAAVAAIAAAVAGAVLIISAFSDKTKKLTAAQQAQLDVQQKVSEMTQEEEVYAKSLFSQITNLNTGYDEKKKLLQQLINISPDYLGQLTMENIATEKGAKILEGYIDNLRKANRAKALEAVAFSKEQQIVEVENQINDKYITTRDDSGKVVSRELKNKDNSLKGAIKSLFTDNDVDLNQALYKRLDNLKGELKTIYDEINGEIKQNSANKTNDKNKDKNNNTGDTDTEDEKAAKAAKAAAKKQASELKKSQDHFKHLKDEAEKFHQDLLKLKERTAAGHEPEQQEIIAAKQKYEALLKKAQEFYTQNAITKTRFNEEERIIEEAQQKELQEIFTKYYNQRFEEQSKTEYAESLALRQEFAEDLKRQLHKEFSERLITKQQYEEALSQIEIDEAEDRLVIAQGYSENVKKAATDVFKFRKQLEILLTETIIEENKKRNGNFEEDLVQSAKRALLKSPKGSRNERDARRGLAGAQFMKDVKDMDHDTEEYKTRYAEFNAELDEIDKEFNKERALRILGYASFALDALTSLNAAISAKENAQLAKERSLNDAKRKDFKKLLDSKVISQAQYDKRMADLQETQDAREREIKRRQAKREKALNIMSSIVNTASAVVEALPNIPLSIAIGALGLFQTGVIATTPLPELGRGGFLHNGPSHSDQDKGLHVVNPRTGNTEMLVERDEAVLNKKAMRSNKQMTLSGTPRQIASALNSSYGGVSFASGAKWLTDPAPRIRPGMAKIMAHGGIFGENNNTAAGSSSLDELIELQKIQIAETAGLREDLQAGTITSNVIYKEITRKGDLYNAAKKASSIRQ